MHYPLPRCTSLSLGAALLLAGSTTQVLATEGGVSSWPLGIEIYGMGILPPMATVAVRFPSVRRCNTPARAAGCSAPNGRMNPACATARMGRRIG